MEQSWLLAARPRHLGALVPVHVSPLRWEVWKANRARWSREKDAHRHVKQVCHQDADQEAAHWPEDHPHRREGHLYRDEAGYARLAYSEKFQVHPEDNECGWKRTQDTRWFRRRNRRRGSYERHKWYWRSWKETSSILDHESWKGTSSQDDCQSEARLGQAPRRTAATHRPQVVGSFRHHFDRTYQHVRAARSCKHSELQNSHQMMHPNIINEQTTI